MLDILEIVENLYISEDGIQYDKYEAQHELKFMNEQNDQEIFLEKQIYLLSTYADVEAYCQELNENLIHSTRDAERDMVDQRNQQIQTILIASTLMVSTIVGVLFQAQLPEDANLHIVRSYSYLVGLSTIVLVVDVALAIELLHLISRFMCEKANANVKHLNKAMDEFKDVRKGLAGRQGNNDIERGAPMNPNVERLRNANGRRFTEFDSDAIDDVFKHHDKEIIKYFTERDKLNSRLKYIIDGGKDGVSFTVYWKANCHILNRMINYLFYLGTILMIVATAVFMYSYFDHRYLDANCGKVLIAIMLFSVAFAVAYIVRMRTCHARWVLETFMLDSLSHQSSQNQNQNEGSDSSPDGSDYKEA